VSLSVLREQCSDSSDDSRRSDNNKTQQPQQPQQQQPQKTTTIKSTLTTMFLQVLGAEVDSLRAKLASSCPDEQVCVCV
jgi:3-deoxy-D-arabino-heptulosonate 7-phosphate (DAHP) synthase class II